MNCKNCHQENILYNNYYRDLFAFSVPLKSRGVVPSDEEIAQVEYKHKLWIYDYCHRNKLCSCPWRNHIKCPEYLK